MLIRFSFYVVTKISMLTCHTIKRLLCIQYMHKIRIVRSIAICTRVLTHLCTGLCAHKMHSLLLICARCSDPRGSALHCCCCCCCSGHRTALFRASTLHLGYTLFTLFYMCMYAALTHTHIHIYAYLYIDINVGKYSTLFTKQYLLYSSIKRRLCISSLSHIATRSQMYAISRSFKRQRKLYNLLYVYQFAPNVGNTHRITSDLYGARANTKWHMSRVVPTSRLRDAVMLYVCIINIACALFNNHDSA